MTNSSDNNAKKQPAPEVLAKLDAAAAFAALRLEEPIQKILSRSAGGQRETAAAEAKPQGQYGPDRLQQNPGLLSADRFDALSQYGDGRFGFFGTDQADWDGEDAPAFAAVAGALDAKGRLKVVIDADDADALLKVVEEGRKLTKTKLIGLVAVDQILALAERTEVRRIEASALAVPSLDQAHKVAKVVDDLRGPRSSALGGLVGRGVLVGIVDTGIDGTHPDFHAGKDSRVVDVWDQTTGTSPSGFKATDENGHGTHVAGIAAGSGAADQAYAGVAPGADLAIVKTSFQTADIAAGVAHIFEVADQRGQPCVVNLSLGGHWGAHDGSSIVERVIDELCDHPGRMVVIAAGNEGDQRLHAQADFSEIDIDNKGKKRWTAGFELMSPEASGQRHAEALLQVYALKEDKFSLSLRTPFGDLVPLPDKGVGQVRGSYYQVETFRDKDPVSGDERMAFVVACHPARRLREGWSVIATARPSDIGVGRLHAWFVGGGGRFVKAATRSHAVGMPGTAFSAITVGSFASRKSWPVEGGEMLLSEVQEGDVSYFSSRGPTRDEHNKPEISAPGQWVVSALSAQATLPPAMVLPEGKYAAMQGTSMAAPYVTGALALLLEREPNLTWAEAKRRLIKSAAQDTYTQGCWNPAWGYGKLNVAALLAQNP